MNKRKLNFLSRKMVAVLLMSFSWLLQYANGYYVLWHHRYHSPFETKPRACWTGLSLSKHLPSNTSTGVTSLHSLFRYGSPAFLVTVPFLPALRYPAHIGYKYGIQIEDRNHFSIYISSLNYQAHMARPNPEISNIFYREFERVTITLRRHMAIPCDSAIWKANLCTSESEKANKDCRSTGSRLFFVLSYDPLWISASTRSSIWKSIVPLYLQNHWQQ